jgi:hypothetical protein
MHNTKGAKIFNASQLGNLSTYRENINKVIDGLYTSNKTVSEFHDLHL